MCKLVQVLLATCVYFGEFIMERSERRNMNVYSAEFMCAFFLFVLTVYIS